MDDRPDRWRPRRFTSALLRVLIFLVPLGAGFGVGRWVGSRLGEPTTTLAVITWWATVIVSATVAANVTDRLARRLLPLTVLLRMTMLFPDKAPSRISVARRAGSLPELRKRIAAVQAGGDPGLGEMSELILSMTTALSNHDRKTRGHSERTRMYADMLAEEMGLGEEDRDRLRWAALLHDVGKLEVPVDVLNKDGGLESAEWDLIRLHPINGMKLIAPLIPWLGRWAKTIEHHHERWDGTGYPHGLAGTDISLGARIVAVADAYDVMTSGRVYQKAKSPAAARKEIAELAGVQFDPAVARALMNISLGRLRWATGPLAVLAEIPFIRGLPQAGRDAATVLTSSAVMATTLAAGIVPTPLPMTPAQVVQVVMAGGDQSALPSTLGLEPDDSPALAVGGGSPGTTTVTSVSDTTVPTTTPTTDGPTTTVAPTTPSTTQTTTPATSPSTTPSTTPATAPITTPTTTPSTTPPTTTPPTTTTTTIPPNRPPSAPAVTASTPSGVLVQVPLTVSDPDGDRLICTMTKAPTNGAATVPADCTVVTYQPPADFVGTAVVTVGVSDGVTAVTTTANITVTAVNKAPVANPDSATTGWGQPVTIPVTANDTDPNGDALTVTAVTVPAVGSTAIVAPGSVRYTPVVGAAGTFTFGYTVCDVDGACADATVTVSVVGSIQVNPDSASVRQGQTRVIKVLDNDVAGSGSIDRRTLTITTDPAHGWARVVYPGVVRYVAQRRYTGTDTFVYQVCDTGGACASATVTVTITSR